MKRIVILFLLAILLSGCELQKEKESSGEKESIVTTNQFEGDKGWKESYIELLKTYDCVGDEYGFTCLYHLVDINEDGTPELLVKTGEDEDELKYVILIALEKGEFGQKSYRAVAKGFDVGRIAEAHGGYGHPAAASVNITKDQREKALILKKKSNRDSLEYLINSSYK